MTHLRSRWNKNLSSEARHDSDTNGVPSGPYTSLASLAGEASAGGVYRVKAVVSDTMGCKLRKKKYLVGVLFRPQCYSKGRWRELIRWFGGTCDCDGLVRRDFDQIQNQAARGVTR